MISSVLAAFKPVRQTAPEGVAVVTPLNPLPPGEVAKSSYGVYLNQAKSVKQVSTHKSAAKLPTMTNLDAKAFNDSARYALMLAEQLQEQAVRDNLRRLVRVWLAAARDAEQASNTHVGGR
jgi:hypothetical protein